jgi:hypothetical protein
MPLALVDTATGRLSPVQLSQDTLAEMAARRRVKATAKAKPRPKTKAKAEPAYPAAWLTRSERERVQARTMATEQEEPDYPLAWLTRPERARALASRRR